MIGRVGDECHGGAARLSRTAPIMSRAARAGTRRFASRTHDVSAAEDALADAYLAALETWPRSGVPGKPEACAHDEPDEPDQCISD